MFKELFRKKEEQSDANELLNFADNVDKIPDPFVVTEAAAKKITSLIKEEPKATGLRIFVIGGGCSGFQYGFAFAEELEEDDTNIQQHGASVVVDNMSYSYIAGSEIDYKDDLQGSSFVIRNPNATSTCGCGSSFAAG
tara:strand:- start:165 stop:578 length:414 start_codon:yes stop_codon:yes gene_type:complete